jgi:hypothetical protein
MHQEKLDSAVLTSPAPVATASSAIWDRSVAGNDTESSDADKRARKEAVEETVAKAERAEVYFSRKQVWRLDRN